VLEFSSQHIYVQAASVKEWARQSCGIDLNPRRIHDAIQRLVKHSVLEKVGHGVYKLTDYGRKILSILLSSEIHKETGFDVSFFVGGVCCSSVSTSNISNSNASNTNVNSSSNSIVNSSCCSVDDVEDFVYRIRLHSRNAKDFEDLVKQLYVVKKVIDCVLKYFKKVLGKSRFRKIVKNVVVSCVGFDYGAHGANGLGKDRSLKRSLKPLEYFYSLGLKPREVGIDVTTLTTVALTLKIYATVWR